MKFYWIFDGFVEFGDMEHLRMQHGSEFGNKSMNGQFLVLNLGTNTVGVGNSSTFHSNSTERLSNPNNSGNALTSSNSTEKQSSARRYTKRKGVARNKDDPDWIPEKKVRKSSISTSRTTKTELRPVVDDNPSSGSSGDGNAMPVSGSGTPPWHLVSLLHLFGWKVISRPGFDDHAYISPVGLTYFSFSKAFEMFLQGTSKYNRDKTFVTTPSGNNGGGFAPWVSIFDSQSVSQSGPASVAENHNKAIEPSVVSQEVNRQASLQRIDLRDKNVVEDGLLSNRSLDAGNGKDGNHGMHQDGRLLVGKSSTQIGSMHGPLESNLDMSRAFDKNLCVPAYGINSDAMKQMPATSVVESIICKTTEALTIERTGKMPECEFVEIMINNKNNEHSMLRDSESTAVRRLSHDAQFDIETMAEDRYLNSSNSLVRTVTRKIEKKPTGSKLHEKFCYSTSQGCSTGETKRMSRRNIGLKEKSRANVAALHSCVSQRGIRRSSRINGKHVNADNELNKKVGADDNSRIAANRAATKDQAETTITSSDVEVMETGPPVSGDMLLKQTSTDGIEIQNLKIHERRESCRSKSSKKAKASNSTRCSASTKDMKSQPSLTDKCHPSSATKRKADRGNGLKKKTKGRRCSLVVRRNGKGNHHEVNLSDTKFSILSWLIDSGTLTENEKAVYIREHRRGDTPMGNITRGGIWCHCCEKVVTPLEFEVHAGSNLHQPWDHIFLASGKTLMQCLNDAWEKEKRQRKPGYRTLGTNGEDHSDDTCGICADGGHLICCDGCPSTFHQECLMLKALPEGSWYCPYCRCSFCMVAEDGSYISNEVLTLLTCMQCGRKYHQECAWANDIQEMDSVLSCFCGKNCQKVAAQLSDILGITNPIEGGFSWTLLRRLDEDGGIFSQRPSLNMECNAKLSLALLVLNECFVPLMDQRTGVDKLSQAVYNCGSNFNRLNYGGFYTIVLEKDGEVITAATLRFHGTHLAEMPFIGTQPSHQRKGMCRRLLKAIEAMLSSLNIRKLIIPAIPDLLETWTKSFGFKLLEQSDKDEIMNLSMMIFAGTTLLQKTIHNTDANSRCNIWTNDIVNLVEGLNRGQDKQSNTDNQPSTLSADLFAILHPEIRGSF
ncbi:hypothetical protein J5N97_021317 [Dioscorea zingiberensis]|uniref:Uncharacterized protein n=1 Tax=Dioscorea zingiberensis TaxID=325984 RepID=A0A9D5CIW8_9LILI|nr:hypothetical protein J5N97_021317 [Dioscorea zingiberensis]